MTQILTSTNLFSGSGGGCFVSNTPIWTPTGRKPIALIKVGDQVLCFDALGTLHVSNVTEVSVHDTQPVRRYFYWGGSFVATPNHLVLSEHGAFRELHQLTTDDYLFDHTGAVRPIEYSVDNGTATVYNFRVATHHTYLIGNHGIRVHNGGGGKSSTKPKEQTDTLRSSAKAQTLELLCEGEIFGLTTGDARSIYLDRTPVQSADLTFNFQGFTSDFRPGTQFQSVIAGIGDNTTSETTIGTAVIQSAPQTRTIQDPNLDAIKVRIGLPSLALYAENGDVRTNTIQFRIYIKEGPTPFVLRLDKTITGKCSSLYEEEYLFPVNNQNSTVSSFQVKVERVSADPTSQRSQNPFNWQSLTAVKFTKFFYPNSAIVAMQFNAEQFNNVPSRSYDCKGRIIRIPSNATVTADGGLNYTGAWNGTFINAWCADPVWVLYDLLTNTRYGAGQWIKAGQIDKFSFYSISQYSNQYVPDGFGGVERRYLCNLYLQNGVKAWEAINAVLAIFRGMAWWGDGTIHLSADMPTAPTKQFTQANVVDGQFNYAATALRARHTVALVTWNDPNDFYREAIEVVTDAQGISLYGVQELKIQAVGCTSRGQAYRVGRWALFSERVDTETVSFKAPGIAAYVRPGEVIRVADSHDANYRAGGKLLDASNVLVTLDAPVTIEAGFNWQISCTLPDLTFATEVVVNPPGTYTALSAYFPIAPLPESDWILQSEAIAPTTWRVLAATEENNVYSITAIKYTNSKFNAIELGWALDVPTTRFVIPVVVSPTRNVTAGALAIASGATYSLTLTASWLAPLNGTTVDITIIDYIVEYQRSGGEWQGTKSSSSLSTQFDAIPEGTYSIRVSAVNLSGKQSDWAYSSPVFVGANNIVLTLGSIASSVVMGII